MPVVRLLTQHDLLAGSDGCTYACTYACTNNACEFFVCSCVCVHTFMIMRTCSHLVCICADIAVVSHRVAVNHS